MIVIDYGVNISKPQETQQGWQKTHIRNMNMVESRANPAAFFSVRLDRIVVIEESRKE